MEEKLLIKKDQDDITQLKLDEGRKYMKSTNFLFTNISPLIDLINGTNEQIENSDLSCFLEKENDPRICINLVMKILHQESKKNSDQNPNITPTWFIYRTLFLSQFIKCGMVNFLQKLILTSLVVLLDRVTGAIKLYGETREDKLTPLLYLGLMIVAYFANSYIDSKYKNMLNKLLARIKVVSQFLIYQKALKTKFTTDTTQDNGENDKKNETDEEKNKSSNIFNLMTIDIDHILLVEYGLYEFISNLFLVVGGFYFLYLKLGQIVISGIYIVLISSVYNMCVSLGIILCIRKALEWKDQRVELTSDVIQGMKQIKYLSWEEIFSQKILKIRRKEFIMIALCKLFDGLCAIFWNSISYLLMFFFLIRYVNEGNDLASTNVFTLITVFNLITFPLGVLPWTANNILSTAISYKRIRKFLDENQIETHQEGLGSELRSEDLAIEIRNLSFCWPIKQQLEKQAKNKVEVRDFEEKKINFKLDIQDLKIKKNTLTVIIGKIGSGKSALFNAILNELDKTDPKNIDLSQLSIHMNSITQQEDLRMQSIVENSKLQVSGELAYVAQTSWLQNETIRNNILFGKEWDPEFYKQCIDACQLAYDFNTFDQKDLYELGPEGKNISGGQKQRIALCRALYQDKDIYLLDDIFSSLDVHIADAVYEKAIKNLLIKRGKTVIMITSHFRFIQSGEIKLENIYLLDNGAIIEDEKLIEQFIFQEGQKVAGKSHDPKINDTIIKGNSIDALVVLKKKQSSYNRSLNSAIHVDSKRELNEEDREKGEINAQTIKTYFASMTWTLFSILILTSFMMQGTRSLIDFWLRAQVTKGDESFKFLSEWFGDFQHQFTALIILQLIITIIRCLTYVICNILSAWRMFRRLNSSILKSQMKFFDKNNEGRIINRISNDTYQIDDELPWFGHVFLENLCESVGYPIGIIILFPWIFILLAGELYLIYLIQKKFRKANRDLKRINSANEGKLIGFLSETLDGIKTIRAFLKQMTFIEDYAQKMTLTVTSSISSNVCLYWLSIRLMLLSNGIFVGVALTITVFIVFDVDVGYTTCALSLTYSVMMFNSFTEVIKFFSAVEQKMVSVERVKQYFDNPLEDVEQQFKVIQRVDQKNIESLLGPIKQSSQEMDINQFSIVFENVCLTYEDNQDPKLLKYALKKFSLSILKNEKIAFVGRTGSGKTSILNVLFKLYDYQYGKIFIDGKDTDQSSLHEIRSHMSVVPQFGFLYKASLRDNLDPLGIIEEDKIQELFFRTGFKINGSETQNGVNLNYQISKSGSNLSNGEKQVINFFRIILQNRDIICLDEATSNMDPKTDAVFDFRKYFKDLYELLFDFAKDRTLLVVTHRLENIQMFDRIVVMEKGEIVEIGTYQELSQKKDGFFNQLLVQP